MRSFGFGKIKAGKTVAEQWAAMLVMGVILIPIDGCKKQHHFSDKKVATPATSASTTAKPLDTLAGSWRVDAVESGDPLVAGDNPWNLTTLTLTVDGYVATRINGLTEQGRFNVLTGKTAKGAPQAQVLFHNWGHREEPRRAAFDSPEPGVLRISMYTKDFGDHNCLTSVPQEFKLPAANDPAYADTVLYTFRRE